MNYQEHKMTSDYKKSKAGRYNIKRGGIGHGHGYIDKAVQRMRPPQA